MKHGFLMCECGKHGRIIYEDGRRRSTELCSQETATEVLNTFVLHGIVPLTESGAVRQQILTSPFPLLQQDADETFRLALMTLGKEETEDDPGLRKPLRAPEQIHARIQELMQLVEEVRAARKAVSN